MYQNLMYQNRLIPALALSAALGLLPAAAIAADGDGLQSFAKPAVGTEPRQSTEGTRAASVTYADLDIAQMRGIFNPSTGRYVGGSLSPPQFSRADSPFVGTLQTAANSVRTPPAAGTTPPARTTQAAREARAGAASTQVIGTLVVPNHPEFGRLGTP